MQSQRFSSLALAAAMMSVGNLSMLGAQSQVRARAAYPGERLRPPKPRHPDRTPDVEREAAALAKRVRRSAIWSQRVANGHQKQLATPRSCA